MKFKSNIIAFVLGMAVMLPMGAYGGTLIVKAVNTPIYVDGKQISAQVLNANGSIYLPAKVIAEAMRGTVEYKYSSLYLETPKTDLEK
jgi:hypothetical protein